MKKIKHKVLLCCDLDRTVLPNGHAPESPNARRLFAKITKHESITLAYVSGRDKNLVLKAIEEYQIPIPDYAICDVGTTIYKASNEKWSKLESWTSSLSAAWKNCKADQVIQYLADIDALTLQEKEKQTEFKVSYYTPGDVNVEELKKWVIQILSNKGITASLIWSLDDITNNGLLDILPPNANKLHAIEFLMNKTDSTIANTVFAGDSGNDIPVIISKIPAVLVKNASDTVKHEAMTAIEANGNADSIYLATGQLEGLNGNYCAGILEGLFHYHPELHQLLDVVAHTLSDRSES